MAHSIIITPPAKRQLSKLPKDAQLKVSKIIDDLSSNPHPPGAKKLKGMDAWRIRVNDYRVIYEIHDNVARVLVIKVAHRKEAYKK